MAYKIEYIDGTKINKGDDPQTAIGKGQQRCMFHVTCNMQHNLCTGGGSFCNSIDGPVKLKEHDPTATPQASVNNCVVKKLGPEFVCVRLCMSV